MKTLGELASLLGQESLHQHLVTRILMPTIMANVDLGKEREKLGDTRAELGIARSKVQNLEHDVARLEQSVARQEAAVAAAITGAERSILGLGLARAMSDITGKSPPPAVES